MTIPDLIAAVGRMKVETGSLACLGCGHEHNCSVHGCAILREAQEQLAAYLSLLDNLLLAGDFDRR